MYSKEEAAKLRQQFWISFGQYMKPIPSADGLTVNWINYKTGVKNIFFKMDADHKGAIISIQISHPDAGIRHLFFEQFEEFKMMLANTMNEEWIWIKDITDGYGKTVSRIFLTLDGVSIFNQQQWPALISFFKSRMITLDEFWSDVKPVFEALN